MKYNGFQWSLKVWLSSSLLTPFITIPIMLVIGRSLATTYATRIDFLFLIILILGIALTPWLIVLLFLKRIVNSRLPPFAFKLVVFLVVTILPGTVFLTGVIASQPRDWTGMFGLLGYSIASALSIWFYKLVSVSASPTSPLNS